MAWAVLAGKSLPAATALFLQGYKTWSPTSPAIRTGVGLAAVASCATAGRCSCGRPGGDAAPLGLRAQVLLVGAGLVAA